MTLAEKAAFDLEAEARAIGLPPEIYAHPGVKQLVRAALRQQAGQVPQGWKLVMVKDLDPLAEALDRADRKGYMPDAIAEEWQAFEYRAAPEAPAQPEQAARYQAANPLGGPAKVFDAMADAIRAGDDYHATLRRYGFAEQASQPVQEHPACKGMNCGITQTDQEHSPECQAEHAAAIAGGRFVKDATNEPEQAAQGQGERGAYEAGRRAFEASPNRIKEFWELTSLQQAEWVARAALAAAPQRKPTEYTVLGYVDGWDTLIRTSPKGLKSPRAVYGITGEGA